MNNVLQMGDGWYEIVTLFLVYIIFIIGSCVEFINYVSYQKYTYFSETK